MPRTKMSDMVRWADDLVCTPRQLLDRGLGRVRVVERFKGSSTATPRRVVFVELLQQDEDGARTSVEVSSFVDRLPQKDGST